ncbi:sugar phosphate isomerase/epimerase family protein [Enterococcus pallens]|uniref:Xylose isomerase-like TIM barrel domain-containing protein n=1 Tax=Enterococcus pallens ATCC BAA-351 TaxID=1158607 RepID=R2SQJ4_9ENTE|nr:sugar phosphate isomerase/epimerase family protein [Enterococcus pallens]EOH97500.1 hypothetical protein UAU_00168 [Enterococcus pallens ATCC BAA-351]EOU21081.1 hypothetical protein I588_01928 [Enterococcus pallens ATCC BAA-351]OJG77785.1 hypothetical protein RV10_GL002178 [Enterococcus pallens]
MQRFAPMNHCYQQYQLETFLKEISEIGYQTIDLWACPTHFFIDSYSHTDTLTFQQLLKKFSLSVSCLSPRQSCPQPFHLAAKGTEAIRQTKNYFRHVVYSAHELECPRIMITSGWAFHDEDPAAAWLRSVEMAHWLSRFAKSYGIKVAMEPLTPQSTKLVNSLERMKRYLTEVDEENLKVIIDTGTISRQGECIADYFQIFGSCIDYCHLTNYQKGQFAHVAWQTGELKLQQVLEEFQQQGYQGEFCLEFTHSSYRENPRKIYQATYDQLKLLEEQL